MFPATPGPGEDFSFTTFRIPRNFSKEFKRRAKLLGNARFAAMRFHDLRGTHTTQLLDRGVPVHQVAARVGDDPAILLRVYAKLTKKKNDAMVEAANALAANVLKG
jgi:integrase